MEVANKYGMVQPGESNTKAVRAVFFIDPEATIRAIIYYPLNLGRNFDELKRALIALQTSDKFKVSMPANWRPGDDVIIPAPGSMRSANERMEKKEEGVTYHDWFFCTKKLPKEIVEKEILKK
jgi:peroxiredoxin (alkyl hydroperoxide reductase subunit C)